MGKALVELLEQAGQEDITAHWMAHYLAELMEQVRTATGPERQQAQRKAADLILELWRHRTYLPGRYPLARFDPVLRTLGRLSDTGPRYQFFLRPPAEEETDDPVYQWLKQAEAIDRASRTAIQHCLNQAIANAAKNEKKWLDLIENLPQVQDEPSMTIIRLIDTEGEDKNELDMELQAALDALDTLRRALSGATEVMHDPRIGTPEWFPIGDRNDY